MTDRCNRKISLFGPNERRRRRRRQRTNEADAVASTLEASKRRRNGPLKTARRIQPHWFKLVIDQSKVRIVEVKARVNTRPRYHLRRFFCGGGGDDDYETNL